MPLHVERHVHVSQDSHHSHQLARGEGKVAPSRGLPVELGVVEGGEVEGEEGGESAKSLHQCRSFSGRQLPAPGQELESRDRPTGNKATWGSKPGTQADSHLNPSMWTDWTLDQRGRRRLGEMESCWRNLAGETPALLTTISWWQRALSPWSSGSGNDLGRWTCVCPNGTQQELYTSILHSVM